MTFQDDSHGDEFGSVVEQLRADRPQATALELDAVKRRVRARVAAPAAGRRARSANLMKSRLAILSMLVSGMLLSTTGAGLAINGLQQTGEASVVAYGPNNPEKPPVVLPEEDTGDVAGDVAGATAGGGAEGGSPLQRTRQVESGGDSGGELPFTGFAAIPILLGGVALLSTGLVLRRRTRDDRA